MNDAPNSKSGLSLRLDRQTILLLISMLGGAGSAVKLASDVADIRERVARIEARLDYRPAVASLDLHDPQP